MSATKLANIALLIFFCAAVTGATDVPTSCADLEICSVTLHQGGGNYSQIGLGAEQLPMTNVSVKQLIAYAYDVKGFQISGGDAWLDSARYDLLLKPKTAQPWASAEALQEQRRQMVQALLAEKFHLKLRRQTQQQTAYELVQSAGGAQLESTSPISFHQSVLINRGHLEMSGAAMSSLASSLSDQLGQHVIDKTGLAGNYDIDLTWAANSADPAESNQRLMQSLSQLGLELRGASMQVETLTVANIDQVK